MSRDKNLEKIIESISDIHVGKLTTSRISLLSGVGVTVWGSLPLFGDLISPRPGAKSRPAKHKGADSDRRPAGGKSAVERSADVVVKVLPTPRKRERKPPKSEVLQPVDPTPKPLKVIRRRREEEPKVFETQPKTLPDAMLEGSKVVSDEVVNDG